VVSSIHSLDDDEDDSGAEICELLDCCADDERISTDGDSVRTADELVSALIDADPVGVEEVSTVAVEDDTAAVSPLGFALVEPSQPAQIVSPGTHIVV